MMRRSRKDIPERSQTPLWWQIDSERARLFQALDDLEATQPAASGSRQVRCSRRLEAIESLAVLARRAAPEGEAFTPRSIFGRPVDLDELLAHPEHRRWADDILVHLGEAGRHRSTASETWSIPTLSTSTTTDPWEALEQVLAGVLEAILGDPGQALAIYGSLAPGEVHHHLVQPIGGIWSRGFVRGALGRTGPDVDAGYPAFTPRRDGRPVPAWMLRSSDLPRHWRRLDDFEGSQYRRRLVAFEGETGLLAVANVYAAVMPPASAKTSDRRITGLENNGKLR